VGVAATAPPFILENKMKKQLQNLILFLMAVAAIQNLAQAQYQYDPNDFASDVIFYEPGSAIPLDRFTQTPFDDPYTALGPPTTETVGDNTAGSPFESLPVIPAYPPFRYYEVVTVGCRGTLILKFPKPVEDNIANPYGIDFIVFANTYTIIDGTRYWYKTDDPNTTIIKGTHVHHEPGVVSVSQDGINWFTFANDPADPNNLNDPNHLYADDFAPTLGRVYDPNNPDSNLYAGNLYWAQPTNPTIPIEPYFSISDFTGRSLDDICTQYYGQSAGGTGFDISRFNLPINSFGVKWFQYIKIHNPRYDGATPEIDAVSDVAGIGDRNNRYLSGDINKDLIVNCTDLNWLAYYWLSEPIVDDPYWQNADSFEDSDNIVNLKDYAQLAANFLKTGTENQP